MRHRISAVLLLLGLSASGCSTYRPFTEELMPTPSVYYAAGLDPFVGQAPLSDDLVLSIFYATDRDPAGKKDRQRYYGNRRGDILRLGEAKVKIDTKGVSWEDLKKCSLFEKRSCKFHLEVTDVREYGPLRLEIPKIMKAYDESTAETASREFADKINERLSATPHKDIFVYVHGYRVEFENPVILAAELWHFLGYRGAMLAYAWPSTPRALAYSGDVETAQYSSQNLRYLLQFLAKETVAERIQIVGYSAGTRVAAAAVRDLGLVYSKEDIEALRRELKIENLILVGSDIDRGTMRSYARDRLTEIPRHLTFYCSEKDGAMKMAKFIYGRERVGYFNKDQASPEVIAYIKEHPNLTFINVTGAANFKSDYGHGYFRNSPWVSGDIFITLLTDRRPEDRGLVPEEEGAAWDFPKDYEERLKALTEKAQRSSAGGSGQEPVP